MAAGSSLIAAKRVIILASFLAFTAMPKSFASANGNYKCLARIY